MSHVSAEALTTGPMKNSGINSPPAEVSIKWAPKWWVESDFKAPNLPLSLRFKASGCHYNSIYNNT
jgi:hypothetical protein